MAPEAITYEKVSPNDDVCNARETLSTSIHSHGDNSGSIQRVLVVLVTIVCCLSLTTFKPPSLIFGERRKLGPAHPVILIPGDGGTQVETKLNKTGGPHYLCTRKTNYW